VLNVLERLAGGHGRECDRVAQSLAIVESLRDQLKAGLSGKTPEPGSDLPPSVPELAERIKAAHKTEDATACPVDAVLRRGACIRHRGDAILASNAAIQLDTCERETSPASQVQWSGHAR
jgi:hypothetical protein